MRQRTGTQRTNRHVAAYVAWRDACLLVDDAFRCWAAERGSEAAAAFARYTAALDVEERAAALYAGLVRRDVGWITTDRVSEKA